MKFSEPKPYSDADWDQFLGDKWPDGSDPLIAYSEKGMLLADCHGLEISDVGPNDECLEYYYDCEFATQAEAIEFILKLPETGTELKAMGFVTDRKPWPGLSELLNPPKPEE